MLQTIERGVESGRTAYEIYIDLHPVDRVDNPEPRVGPALWTLSDALIVRGAKPVGSSVPLPPSNPTAIRVKRKRSIFARLFRR